MSNLVQEINEPEFVSQVLGSQGLVLAGFLAGWSKPCQMIEPVLDEVAKAGNGAATIFKVNVDDHPDLGTAYGIQSVPTLVYFVNGTMRAKIVGMVSAKAILAKLYSLMLANPPVKHSRRRQEDQQQDPNI